MATAHKKPGAQSYYAVACSGMLRLTSRKTRDLWTALYHREALRRLVQRMAELSGPLEVTLPTAVMEALPSMIELRLRLTVRFRAERWVAQPLGSPTYVGTTQAGLHQAVSSWRRLHAAREALRASSSFGPASPEEHQSWLNLRNTFLDVEAEAGMSRELRDKRLAQAEQAHAAQRRKVAERWNRKQMAREDDLEVGRRAAMSPLPCALRARRLLSELAVAEKGLSESAARRASAGRKVNLTGKQSSSESSAARKPKQRRTASL